MPKLWGIDDDDYVEQIQLKAEHTDTFAHRLSILLIMTTATTCGLVAIFEHFNVRGGWLTGALAGLAGPAMFSYWQRRRKHEHLPKILDREGRCRKCGYDLKNNLGGTCPECGKAKKQMTITQLRTKDITSILQAVPGLVGIPENQMWANYDQEVDVLYIVFQRPQKATDSEMRDDGLIIHRRGRKIVGVTILDASTR